jgi:GAF domain-containing protein
MKRRDKAGGKAVRPPHRKTLTHRNAPKGARRRSLLADGTETTVARLTHDLKETLEQQAATSAVLQVISRSATDLQPVFETIASRSVTLCGATYCVVYRFDGELISIAGHHNLDQAALDVLSKIWPMRPDPEHTLVGQAIVGRTIVHVRDAAAEPRYTYAGRRGLTLRTFLAVPMLRGETPIGAIALFRKEVELFSDRQIELVKAFADQAVIAIENARLLNELRESLQQQTATADVLKVISSSPGDLKPVFDTLLANAMRICEAQFGNLFLYDGEGFTPAAWHNVPQGFIDFYGVGPHRAGPKTGLGRVASKKEIVHIEDITTEQAYVEGDPLRIATVELLKARTYLAVPMLKDEQLVGAIVIYRQEVRPFAEKQIELVKSFAAQAVIAIENTRLLNELRQSLEQQTATSEMLRVVISSSATDLRPVFETIAHNSVHLCGATYGAVFRFDGEMISFVAHHDLDQAGIDTVHQMFPLRPNTSSLVSRAILERNMVHIEDVAAETNNPYAPIQRALGIRTFLGVPMLRDGNPIGAIALYRREVGLFSDRQIALVKAFADQAVIAIENARLLNDLNRLNQELEQRVTDQVSEIERMGKLRRFLPAQVADLIVASGTEGQLESHRREITALFCDLRGFTGFSESSDPEDVMALLRDYHAAIGEIINKYGGTLERYAGDGVMVVFNDPIPVDNPALQAVLMAIEMRAAIGELIEKWRKLGHAIGFGIGIAHGFATLGTIGFEGRFDYAPIGTVSNVASRLCDEAKPGQILISPRVLMAVEKDITVESVGDFALKGIRRPLTAYNVLDRAAP